MLYTPEYPRMSATSLFLESAPYVIAYHVGAAITPYATQMIRNMFSYKECYPPSETILNTTNYTLENGDDFC